MNMRRLSRIFQPFITIPKNAKIKNTDITCKSQKLLLELGLVRPTSSGLFSLLPLARRAADKLEVLVRKHFEAAGGQRLSLPALTAAKLWETTERLGGQEILTLEDRHDHKYVLSPTHEEAIADLLADVGPLSYKQLPLLLYQIGNKYRDEHRPKHGLLRAREFTMLDAYGIHDSGDSAATVYDAVSGRYEKLFKELELPVFRVSAPTGEMGGSLSHEWQLLAQAGEDQIRVCASCSHAALPTQSSACSKCGRETEMLNSIEVGHTFILGTKYSEPLQANFVPAAGGARPLIMSCYGVGITRLLAASLEALSTDDSLRWPARIAPYSAIVIGPKKGSKEWSSIGVEGVERVYRLLDDSSSFFEDVLLDDRHEMTIGKRVMQAERMGYPLIVVCGRTLADSGKCEVLRRGATPQLLAPPDIAGEPYALVNKA